MLECQLDIIIAHKPWHQGHYAHLIQTTVHATLDYLKMTEPTEVCIKLTSATEIQRLNANYRGKDQPTNVLAFPLPITPSTTHALGDLVLAFETIQIEAIAQKKNFEHHLTHLVVHGLLHLLGYDHTIESDAVVMESLEKQILQTLAVKDPYETDE